MSHQSRLGDHFTARKRDVSSDGLVGKQAKPLPNQLFPESKKELPKDEKPSKQALHLDVNSAKYEQLLASLLKDDIAPQVHVQELDTVERILRIFDLIADYGPSTGHTRLERWKRAEKLGLEPRVEIKEILETEEGQTLPKYRDPYIISL